MTVWIVSQFYHPEENATGYLLTRLAEGLAGQFGVKVLCTFPSDKRVRSVTPRDEVLHGVVIRRCFSTFFDKDNLIFRLLNALAICVSVFFALLRRLQAADHVLVVTNPPLLPFAASVAARIKRGRCSIIVHDVYPEAMVAVGVAGPSSLIVRFLDFVHRYLYRRVDRIVVLGRDMELLVARKTENGNKKIVRIPNGAEVGTIVPDDRTQNRLLNGLGLSSKFVVANVGNMGRTHGIENLFACTQLLSQDKTIHFLFVGNGAKKRWLEEEVRKTKAENITILPYDSRESQSVVNNACDVVIISFIAGMNGISVPSRMYNVMSAGKPIIAVAEQDSELALVIEEEGIGWLVPPDKPELIVEAIRRACADRGVLAGMGIRAREAAVRKYSFQKVIDSYRAMLLHG
ncbi:MAG: glycosyltransferase family 4 protein [Ignavibacteriales bacterium]|nr:glycosyltransferase family 4 protein [Ignavibacteriales bacterium]